MVKVDWVVFSLQIITFLLAMPLVWKLYISKLSKTLKDRDELIRGGIDKVEKGREEIENLKTGYEKKLEDLKAEAKAAMEKAVYDGEQVKQQIMEDAKTESSRMLEAAKKEIETEKIRAIEEVKGSMIDISMLAAEKVIKANITKKASTEAVEQAMQDISKN
ncbi:MAG: F0F1 ATP synthase subunit B [Candidatus Goldiibacteriota bacterium]